MKITIDELRRQCMGERPQRRGQLRRAELVLAEHPEAVLIQTRDEYTGFRFGRAQKRAGQSVKIGGCRQPHYYQLWASWATADLRPPE